jgi:hypothetical protein
MTALIGIHRGREIGHTMPPKMPKWLEGVYLPQNILTSSSLSGRFFSERLNRQSMPVDCGRCVGATGTK